jgi:Fe2+ or Zn2+ uptake regulation protein
MLRKELDSKTALILRALDSDLRRELLKIALEGSLDADKFYNAVVNRGFNIRYKESVYKELQTLVQADLIDKYYDVKTKKILYRLKAGRVIVDIKSMETEIMDHAAEP